MEPFYKWITDFIFAEDGPEESDIIFVPGGHTGEHAHTAAGLYLKGYAPLILPSGKYSKQAGRYIGPGEGLYRTEWEYLKAVLTGDGVPGEAVLKEEEATFTWENAIYSRKLLEEKQIKISKAILCCQAHHARRALMYYQEQFPDVKIAVVPTVTGDIRRDNWFLDSGKTQVVLGEVERIGRQFHCVLPLGGGRDINDPYFTMPAAGRI